MEFLLENLMGRDHFGERGMGGGSVICIEEGLRAVSEAGN
jgi:hypothetical protein